MFKFDDRYIIFVLLSPGVFALALICVLYALLPFQLPIPQIDSTLIQVGFVAIASLLFGILLWYVNHKELFLSKHRLHFILEEIETGQFTSTLNIDFTTLSKKFKVDFNKEFLPPDGKEQLRLFNYSFDDIYFGLDRKIGLAMPSAFKLIREFLEQVIVSLYFIIPLYILGIVIRYTQCKMDEMTLTLLLSFVLLIVFVIFLRKALKAFDHRFYYALLNVYTSKHYWNLFQNKK